MFFIDKDVCRLDVPVENVDLVKAFQPFEALNSCIPNAGFFDKFFNRLVFLNVYTEVASFKELCHQTEGSRDFIIERVHVTHDVGIIN